MAKKEVPCEVYSRVCGYFAPLPSWNKGKRQEFRDRRVYKPSADLLQDDLWPDDAVSPDGEWQHRTVGGRGVVARVLDA